MGDGLFEQRPYGGVYMGSMVMNANFLAIIEQIDSVTGKMDLADNICWRFGDEGAGVNVMIARFHINIVHVEQRFALSLAANLRHEHMLWHGRGSESHIGGRVLYENRAFERVLGLLHIADNLSQRFFRIWQRQEVVQVISADCGLRLLFGIR